MLLMHASLRTAGLWEDAERSQAGQAVIHQPLGNPNIRGNSILQNHDSLLALILSPFGITYLKVLTSLCVCFPRRYKWLDANAIA